MNNLRFVFSFGRSQVISGCVLALCFASTAAVGTICYCSTGLVSACQGYSNIKPCGGQGQPCVVDAGGSDQELLTRSSDFYGFNNQTGGAFGKCYYLMGTCDSSGQCIDDGSGVHTVNIQSSSPSGTLCHDCVA